jgi:hypothetical protein
MWLWIATLKVLSLILLHEPHKNINNIFILIFSRPENITVRRSLLFKNQVYTKNYVRSMHFVI